MSWGSSALDPRMQPYLYARVQALRIGLRIVGTLLKPDRSDVRIGPGKGPQHHRSYHAYQMPASRLSRSRAAFISQGRPRMRYAMP
jgi:hypothetical protein